MLGTTGPFLLGADLPGDVNGDGQVTLADLQQFAQTPFPAAARQARTTTPLDFNRNGQVGQDDVRLLLRNLAPLSPASVGSSSSSRSPSRTPPGATCLAHGWGWPPVSGRSC
ncbi:MAG: hypothetical protein U0835_23235 [Isosphaeraceae bacterium]